MNLKGKKVLVTGASSGIGRAIAIQLSKMGAQVVLIARREEYLQDVIRGLSGKNHSCYSFDLMNLESLEKLLEKIIAEVGALDGYVHSAGITLDRPLKFYKPEIVQNIMTINFSSFLEIVRIVSKKNNHNPGMSIVGISSVSSIIGKPAHTVYSASKAAMDAAVRCLAKELAPKEIRINTIRPGMIKTSMYDEYMKNNGQTEEITYTSKGRQFLGLGEPEDVANMVLYLLDEQSKFVTGASMNVDGGCSSN